MNSDTHYFHQYQQQQRQVQQNMINNGMYGDKMSSRFMSNTNSACGDNSISSGQNLSQIRWSESQLTNIRKQELQQMMYQNLAQSRDIGYNYSLIDSCSSDRVDGLMAMAPATNLLRQCSSPAGFFEHVNIDNGYSMIGSVDKFRPANGSVPDSSSTNKLKSPMAFSTGLHSSSRLPSHIIKSVGKNMAQNSGGFDETHTKDAGYVASFPIGSWNESSRLTDQMSSLEKQNEGESHTPTGLTHQLSLPTSSTQLSVMTNLLQLQDSVPLRSRAKRGCATHPRSIAERVRRTRISERIRKLQDLVPNMDKQTSIADMLDLAVDYIKELQTQVETLADHQAKCRCPNKKKL